MICHVLAPRLLSTAISLRWRSTTIEDAMPM